MSTKLLRLCLCLKQSMNWKYELSVGLADGIEMEDLFLEWLTYARGYEHKLVQGEIESSNMVNKLLEGLQEGSTHYKEQLSF